MLKTTRTEQRRPAGTPLLYTSETYSAGHSSTFSVAARSATRGTHCGSQSLTSSCRPSRATWGVDNYQSDGLLLHQLRIAHCNL